VTKLGDLINVMPLTCVVTGSLFQRQEKDLRLLNVLVYIIYKMMVIEIPTITIKLN
jgi:hypothetical protein